MSIRVAALATAVSLALASQAIAQSGDRARATSAAPRDANLALRAVSDTVLPHWYLSPFSFTPFIGVSFPVGAAGDSLDPGVILGAAVDMRPAGISPFGLRLLWNYARMRTRERLPLVQSRRRSETGGDLDVVFWFLRAQSRGVTPYLGTGLTYAQLPVQFGSGDTNPTITEHHFGFNVTLGMDIPVKGRAIRVDARYKYVNRDVLSYQTIPLTIGLRI